MGDQGSVTSGLFLFVAAFLATGVEMVEAMTIILATGITRGWRSTFVGTGAAAVILAAIVAVFGLALKDIEIAPLRIVVGTFLLIFGLQWLRKAILRWGGVLAYHDEERIFAREVQALRGEAVASSGIDWQAFVVAFKGVLLEGLEAVFIVVTFGLSAGDKTLAGFSGVGLAAVGAGAALVVVVAAAILARKPLASIPENTMKAAVGLLLGAFGTFWAGEGVGIEWPLGEGSILLLLGFYTLLVWALTARVRALQAVSRSAHGVAAR